MEETNMVSTKTSNAALFTKRYFTCVESPSDELREGYTFYLLTKNATVGHT